ncbi:MAG: hypothetical protein IVW55_13090, partial [Chloroflexi bacterium]|nr:hypothetical protein [Chloroflexota bacterium]
MTGRTNTLIGAAAARCLLCLLVLFVLNFLLYGSGTADARVNRGSNSSKAAVATGALTGNAASTSTASGTGYRSLASPNRSAPATLPPIPAGMPAYFNFGLFNSDVANVPPSTPWDFRYQYLAGGANTGDGWATWSNPPGQYAINYIQDARSRGMIPAFMYYQILQSAPYYDEYQNMQSPSTMYSYFADWKLLMTKSAQAGGGPIVVMLEADLTGVMQQLSTNDDAATVAASVAASGFPDAAGYPNNFRGMYQAMLHIRDLYAPGVLVTLDASSWGPGDDIVLALRDDPNYNWQLHADRTAAFLNSTGPGFDMISWNPSDRDAAWYQSQGSNRWWDFNNVTQPTFNTMGAWLGRIVQDTNKRALMWQVPNGNRVYRSENNTDGHWQDNKTEYFLNPTSGRQHIQEWANLGVMGIWWGAGVGSQSHYYDAKGDGITNPPPINGNTEVAQYADDDGGYIRLQSDAYYSQGPVVLPGGTPPSPTVAPTGTPPSPTVAPTGTPPSPT